MDERFMVVVTTKRLPGSFNAPRPLRGILSYLSEKENEFIGSFSNSMSRDEAEGIASESTKEVYIDGYGHLRSSKGILVKI